MSDPASVQATLVAVLVRTGVVGLHRRRAVDPLLPASVSTARWRPRSSTADCVGYGVNQGLSPADMRGPGRAVEPSLEDQLSVMVSAEVLVRRNDVHSSRSVGHVDRDRGPWWPS